MAYIQKRNPFKKSPLKQETVKRDRKKHARSSREHGHHVEGQKPGTESTHLMSTYTGDDPKKHFVAPTITTDKKGYKKQSFSEALDAGEVYEFKSKRKAEKFAAGSWKKGKDKREAMREYRKSKRNK